MNEIIERAAKAYWNAGVAVTRWDDEAEDQREVVRLRIRAAIKAMREPTEGMCAAVPQSTLPGMEDTAFVFRTMIDAALSVGESADKESK